jgi:hypothetical protein
LRMSSVASPVSSAADAADGGGDVRAIVIGD